MISLLLSIAGGLGAFYALHTQWSNHPYWTVIGTVAGFFLVTMIINLLLRKKLQAAFMTMQNAMLEDRAVLERKVKAMMGKVGPAFQTKIEQEQAASIRRALEMLDGMKKFEKWSLMVRPQLNTLRAQFYFQLKEFDLCDHYLKHAMMMDPMLVAMQMVRFYKKNEQKKLEKSYLKGIHRFRDEKGAIIYALYSWILVQQNKIDEAIQVLVAGQKKAPNQILQQNWNALVNGKVRSFSNAGFGDMWYSLYLEQPRMQRIQQPAYGYRRR